MGHPAPFPGLCPLWILRSSRGMATGAIAPISSFHSVFVSPRFLTAPPFPVPFFPVEERLPLPSGCRGVHRHHPLIQACPHLRGELVPPSAPPGGKRHAILPAGDGKISGTLSVFAGYYSAGIDGAEDDTASSATIGEGTTYSTGGYKGPGSGDGRRGLRHKRRGRHRRRHRYRRRRMGLC
jgi:hypothetical protein